MSTLATSTSATSALSSATTIVGPLTTTYTPSASDCTDIFYANNPANTNGGWLAQGAIGDGSTSCMPTSYHRESSYHYSPGVCPAGYDAACSYLTPDASNSDVIKTVATCCPTGYTCFANRPAGQIYGCTSYLPSDTVLTMRSAFFDTIKLTSTTSYAIITSSTTMSVTGTMKQINAYGVIIERATDDPEWTAATATTTSSDSSSTTSSSKSSVEALTTSSSTNAASSSTTSSSSSSNAVNTATAAGIAIGVIAGLVLLILCAFFIYKRRSRIYANVNAGPTEQKLIPPYQDNNSASATDMSAANSNMLPVSELRGETRKELPGSTTRAVELSPYPSDRNSPGAAELSNLNAERWGELHGSETRMV
ncbi:transmembrane alpha-helix domain-containing protein [Rutstroemia sp. NJR-2017a BVV2]|nr:transmembrane alpha-helix domain-containing protein [Rutstroemia sp. NJR-2017a BVV2]